MISFTPDQVFVVTGASSGLGEGVALTLNKLGATVVGIGRNVARLNAMRDKCAHPERCFVEERDLTQGIDQLPAYVKQLREKYGKFRGMAICHGITAVRPMQLIGMDGMQDIFNCNYFAPMMLAKGFVDKRNNTGRGAALVAISSIAAVACNRGMIEYSGTKAALTASMKSLAREVAPFGIRVNTVAPSDIKTPMVLNASSYVTPDKIEQYPLGIGEVDDVANMIVYLLSDAGKWITTQNYVIDCGVI